ncbi:phage head spike fiber domain-containing protein [Muriicola soli]|uniref:CBM-cenC domain-containing protein n=1 Tax=Muriicola soli TaxID=2507538 RepID=A0A411ECQ0_9FLAO|nr:hypothetical protein [Muriicola soli]QBA65408.1 hypothetical protein EQY75_13225 [Muriicola soli]
MLNYTEDFQDETWFRDEAQVVNNITEDPFDKPTADLLDISDNPKESRIYQFLDSIPEGEYIFSLFLKAPPGTEGKYAIGMEFNGDKRLWNKSIVSLNDSSWTRASVRLKTEGTGRLTVFPAYALIKGSTMDKVYAWGAQLEQVNSDKSADLYCGRNTFKGGSSNAYFFIQE